MSVKYQCPKCEARYIEWGAEKLGFKCPKCAGQDLVRVGAAAATVETSTTKRRIKKPEKSYEDDEVVSDYEGYDEGMAGSGVDDLVIPGELGSYGDSEEVSENITDEEGDIAPDGDVEIAGEFEVPEDIEFEGEVDDEDAAGRFNDE